MKKNPWLTIIGINGDNVNMLSHEAIKSIKKAEKVFGSQRHLNVIKTLSNKTYLWATPFEKGLKVVLENRGRKTVVLFSGNPFWYGAGNIIINSLKRKEWISFHSPSSFSLASSKLGWAIQNTVCLGLHHKPINSIRSQLAPNTKFLLLLKNGSSVKKLAHFLSYEGFGKSELSVMESLGYKNEKIRKVKADKLNFNDIKHPVCVGVYVKGQGDIITESTGKPDYFFNNNVPITKQPIRSITIATLSPKPSEHLWDLGSGSGSISLEWMLVNKNNKASAVEKEISRAKIIKKTANRFGLQNLEIFVKDYNKILYKLKKPDAVFIGGGLNKDNFYSIWNIVPKHTKIVTNSVTLETYALLIWLNEQYKGNLRKIEISEINNLGKKKVWSKNYPIIQWSIIK